MARWGWRRGSSCGGILLLRGLLAPLGVLPPGTPSPTRPLSVLAHTPSEALGDVPECSLAEPLRSS